MELIELFPEDLAKVIEMVDDDGSTVAFKKTLKMCEEYVQAGMTPRILWDQESSSLRIRCDELAGKRLH